MVWIAQQINNITIFDYRSSISPNTVYAGSVVLFSMQARDQHQDMCLTDDMHRCALNITPVQF